MGISAIIEQCSVYRSAPPQPSWQLSQWWAKNVLPLRETLIKALSDCTLEFLYTARNNPTLTASYLRKVMTKSCIKIPVKSDSAIEPAFFYITLEWKADDTGIPLSKITAKPPSSLRTRLTLRACWVSRDEWLGMKSAWGLVIPSSSPHPFSGWAKRGSSPRACRSRS